ncbi:unnamed protein product [Brassica oleracea]
MVRIKRHQGSTTIAIQSLQQEVIADDIHVTLVFPPDTDTPGFEEEQKSRPEVLPEVTTIIAASPGSMKTVMKKLISLVKNVHSRQCQVNWSVQVRFLQKDSVPTLNEHLRLPKQEMISTQGMMSLGAKQEAGTGKQEEKTVFDVKLEKFDTATKIKVIKEVRVFASLGLKEAKELVEKVPVVIKQGLTKEEANGIIEKIKDVGGVAVME